MDKVKISFIIITFKRNDDLKALLSDILKTGYDDFEIIVWDNNTDGCAKEVIEELGSEKARYFSGNRNYGVAAGRNKALKEASGDIIISLDDDIHIENIDNLIQKTTENLYEQGFDAVTYNIINYFSKDKARHEFPHCDKTRDYSESFETYYILGGASAVKASVFKELGGFPEDFGIYGTEEIDLSFRMINSGCRILYCGDVIIEHKTGPGGRFLNRHALKNNFINRTKIAVKYLKKRYILTTYFSWGYYYLTRTGNILEFIKGSISLVFYFCKVRKRAELFSDNFYRKIKELNGRIIY